ncbi:MAG: formate dehydrogenase accessory sulfurtransferase FdhD [Beijerinckiaceae bacterium]
MPPNEGNPPDGAAAARGLAIGFAGQPAVPHDHRVPVETPVNLIYGSIPFAVMMATPSDLEDFACGFSFSEGIVDNIQAIRDISVEGSAEGIRLSIALAAGDMQRHLGRARNLTGRTGCGVCGIADLSEMPRLQNVAEGSVIASAALARALAQAESHQSLNRITHAVHGAAFCSPEGDILLMREDVGRHNALDKLIGAAMRKGIAAADGFVLVTSRASYEMVEKTARFGTPVLAAMSAPTSLAIARADACGVTLVAVARPDGAIVFSRPDRIKA